MSSPFRSFIVALWMCVGVAMVARGQNGFHYLRHYQHSFTHLDYKNNDLIQTQDGVLYIANRKGIITFDGAHWEHILTKGSVYVLKQDPERGRIYVGGKSDFGYLKDQLSGIPQYISLSQDQYVGYDFVRLEVLDNRLYAFADELLVAFDLLTNSVIQTWQSEATRTLTGFFVCAGKPYLVWENEGIVRLDAEQGQSLVVKLPDAEDEVSYYTPLLQSDEVLLGTLEGKLFRFDGQTLKKIEIDEATYVEKSQPISAVDLGNNLIAFATLRGGCLMVNIQTGKVKEIINTQSGLPVNEVLAIAKDSQQGLWMLHSYGYTRLDMRLPFRNFSYYPGLAGRILDASRHNGRFYVGTTEGLFVLEEIKNYRQVAYVVQQRIDPNQVLKKGGAGASSQQVGNSIAEAKKEELFKDPLLTLKPNLRINPETGQLTDPAEEELSKKEQRQLKKQERRRQRLLQRLEEQQEEEEEEEKKEEEESSPTPEQSTEEEQDPRPESETTPEEQPTRGKKQGTAESNRLELDAYKLQVKRELELQSVKYLYQRVSGLEAAEVRQIVRLKDQLVILHRDGVFALTDAQKAEKISSRIPIAVLPAPMPNHLLIQTAQQVSLLAYQKKQWKEVAQTAGFQDELTGVATDPQGRIWALGKNFIHLLTLAEADERLEAVSFPIKNNFDDPAIPIIQNDTLFVLLSEVAYFFDADNQKFVVDTLNAVTTQVAETVLSQNQEIAWLKQDRKWDILGKHPYNAANAFLLNLLGQTDRLLTDTDTDYVWVITHNNQLYRFHINHKLDLNYGYPLRIHAIRNPLNDTFFPNEKIYVPYEANSIDIEFRRADYLSGDLIDYQYILLGGNQKKTNDWSDWTTNNKLSFSALDNGKYTLKIRGRNIFGEISESPPITFRIRPPYWQTSWFYALEALFFAFLVGITAFFNRKLTQETRWIIILRQTLTILTLIMCMEFLKVVLESWVNISGSPVVDFGMEVLFALMIFPVERLLAHYVFGNDPSALPVKS